MNIGDFLHSKRWKLMQNYIYSWGASVVLIGALFKLQHYPGAGFFLGVGLSIEAIIFFISAFEPMMELPDWKVVYPQLRTGKEDQRQLFSYAKADERYRNFFKNDGGSGSISLGDIPEEQMRNLKESFDKLAATASGLQDISSATAATDNFVQQINKASESISTVVDSNKTVSDSLEKSAVEMTESYKDAAVRVKATSGNMADSVDKSVSDLSGTYASTAEELKKSVSESSEGMKKSIEQLSGSLSKTADDYVKSAGETSGKMLESSESFNKQLSQSASQLNESYKSMTEALDGGFKGLGKSSGSYVQNLDKLNKNLAAVNSSYELHLKGAAKVDEVVKGYTKSVDEIGKLMSTSVEETKKFNENTKEMNENIQALNEIYGKMLGALNGKK